MERLAGNRDLRWDGFFFSAWAGLTLLGASGGGGVGSCLIVLAFTCLGVELGRSI